MNDDLTEISEAIDMAGWMDSQGIDYRETRGTRGIQLNVRECPVCGGSGWKVYMNAESGLGNCFHGDHPPGQNFSKFKFIQAQLAASNRDTVEHMKQYAATVGWRPPRKKSVDVSADIAWRMPDSIGLPHNGRSLPYLTNRGITPEMARYFHLRYAMMGATYRYRDARGNWRFQDYSRRVLIPVFDLDAKLVTFQGRDTSGTAEKKYLFPPGIEASGAHLYNGLNVVPGTKRIVIAEGAFDVIAVKLALDADPGLRDVVPVGTFGKHLSSGDEKTQLEKLARLKRERGLEEVTIMWDGEIRATADAIAAGKLMLGIGLRVRIAMLPALKDPNEVAPQVVRDAFYKARALSLLAELELTMLRSKMNAGGKR